MVSVLTGILVIILIKHSLIRNDADGGLLLFLFFGGGRRDRGVGEGGASRKYEGILIH